MVTALQRNAITEGWINGGSGFEPGVFDYLEGDQSSLESDALERLAADNQLAAYRHAGSGSAWTLRDKALLQNLWESGNAPWRVWE